MQKNAQNTTAKKNSNRLTAEQKAQREAQKAEEKRIKAEAKAKEKAEKAEKARLEYDGENLYLIHSVKVNGEAVEKRDRIGGTWTAKAIILNIDTYNWAILTASADGTCWVDCYTKASERSASYTRKNTLAKDTRKDVKKWAIEATRNLPFADVMTIAHKAKNFKECVNKQALIFVDTAVKAQEARIAKVNG